jgi:hypothetical protein
LRGGLVEKYCLIFGKGQKQMSDSHSLSRLLKSGGQHKIFE